MAIKVRRKQPWEEEQTVGLTPPSAKEDAQMQLARVFSAPAPTSITPREINPEVKSLFEDLRNKVNQAPVTADDIMRSREYQNLASAIDFTAGQAQAANRRDLASRGMLRSTPAVQTMASTDAYYTAKKQELIPQLIQAEQARRQQEIANAASLLSQLSNLHDTAYSQGLSEFNALAPYRHATIGQQIQQDQWNKEFETQNDQWNKNFAMTEAELTGQYQPDAARQLGNIIIQAKESYKDPNDGTTPEEDNARATAARNALVALGFSPEQVDRLLGAGVTLEQAQANLSLLTLPTRQAKQDEYAQKVNDLELKKAQLEYEIATDPDLGVRAQKQRELERLEAEIAATRALEASRLSAGQSGSIGTSTAPAQPETVPEWRQYLRDVYGVTNTGLTTDYQAFEQELWQIIDAINRGYSRAQIAEYINAQADALVSHKVDPNALLRYADSLLEYMRPQGAQGNEKWYGTTPR